MSASEQPQGIDSWPPAAIADLVSAEPKSVVPPISLESERANLTLLRRALQAGRADGPTEGAPSR
jgi:hypothetical protein